MGATEFLQSVAADTANGAFIRAQTDARYDYGHAGYTGTIAEKDGFIRIDVLEEGNRLPTLDEAIAYANKLLAEDDERVCDKWGPAGVIKCAPQDDVPVWLFFGWASS